MAEPRHTQAVRGWFAIHRPDVKKSLVDSLITDKQSFGLLAAGFEAGRQFQAEYSHLDPMNITIYDPMHPIPDAPAPEPTPAEVVAATKLPTTLIENVEVSDIKSKSQWIHRRTQDHCTVSKVENKIVIVADSFGDARRIPVYMFRQSYNPKGG